MTVGQFLMELQAMFASRQDRPLNFAAIGAITIAIGQLAEKYLRPE